MNESPAAQTTSESEMQAALEAELREALAGVGDWLEPGIEEMIAYHLGWASPKESQGKRIRPMLTLLCSQSAGGDWRAALPAAGAIEWIHNFSLIHDDIQDHSEFRRGRPTVWKVWGRPQAINTGDAIFALARQCTHRLLENKFAPETVLEVHRRMDESSLALTRGQHLDILFESTDSVTTDAYLSMIRGKTAALLGTACELGALLASASKARVQAYKRFGENLGLAFQVIDDLLGIWGSAETTGKSSVDDLKSRKKTLPIIHGLEHSPEFGAAWAAERHTENNVAAMKRLLDESGSRQFTTNWAQRYTDEAMASLKAADPHEPGYSELSSLAARLLQRVA